MTARVEDVVADAVLAGALLIGEIGMDGLAPLLVWSGGRWQVRAWRANP